MKNEIEFYLAIVLSIVGTVWFLSEIYPAIGPLYFYIKLWFNRNNPEKYNQLLADRDKRLQEKIQKIEAKIANEEERSKKYKNIYKK